ncbi:membrane anchored protein in chemotaxis locus [Shewanella putrefaciens]|uniref:membrane anchored protein in chemotaxis locus n=1 Tax=Shewanella putrefaciens TaxID=24 RepID=UPI0018E847B1|nr:membrane anchored protein in chemotaxis locus [Shewanella putrefaciens]
MSTNVVLIMVLMGIAIVCLGALSLDYHRKISLLRDEVKRLESTQVLLMVPDEQAEAIATWLASHPDQTKAMLKLASPGEQKAVTLGPETLTAPEDNIPPLLDKSLDKLPTMDKSSEQNQTQTPLMPEQSNTTNSTGTVPVIISENADGVKIISLPNGGIRVTTREGD